MLTVSQSDMSGDIFDISADGQNPALQIVPVRELKWLPSFRTFAGTLQNTSGNSLFSNKNHKNFKTLKISEILPKINSKSIKQLKITENYRLKSVLDRF